MSRPTFLLKKSLAGLALASLPLLGCEPPPVVPTSDARQSTRSARVEGNLVVQSRARGNVVVFLYDAERPPPPQGTGRPVSFTVIPASEVFGPALHGDTPGPFTAPFTFSLVATGRYTLRGFIDADGCLSPSAPQGCRRSDFNPWYGVTSEPNAGDVGGAAVDPSTGAMVTVEVAEDEDGQPQPVTGVAVSFSDTARVPVDRPAFKVQGDPRVVPGGPIRVYRLTAQPIQEGVVDQRPPGMMVSYVDANRDGQPDDANGDGVPELWPRVVVRKLADVPGVVDENDLDRNGVPDTTGPFVDYLHADGTQDGKADVVVLAAGLVPDGPIAALRDEQGRPRMQPVFVPELQLAVRPMAFDARDPAAPALLKELPRGRYAVVLIQFTGQTWRVPNELDPALATAVKLPPLESQAFFLEVRD
ncbi:MAG TPA: hypothetical protein VE153_08240 [Myxococcus sp.]|jgi:hypothetical protein|nr:hypothetical protein [Myxococcus sp.]